MSFLMIKKLHETILSLGMSANSSLKVGEALIAVANVQLAQKSTTLTSSITYKLISKSFKCQWLTGESSRLQGDMSSVSYATTKPRERFSYQLPTFAHWKAFLSLGAHLQFSKKKKLRLTAGRRLFGE